LFRKKKSADEISDELRFHLEKEIELNMARGMSPEEARRQALISFGGVQQTREKLCEGGWRQLPETLFQDLRFGLRMLIKAPGFALAAVLTLALGIGANAYIFSFADALLLRPLVFSQLDRLMTLFISYRGDLGRQVPPADFLDWQQQNQSFASLSR
jgi:macrolide transport system ATP-binding/permease protein